MKQPHVFKWTVMGLLPVAVLMFACGFALMSLFESLGVAGPSSAVDRRVPDESRRVRVHFVSANAAGMAWAFYPKAEQVDVQPGAVTEMLFVAQNPTDRVMKAQAVPGISPGQAAAYFHKTECFCFTQQQLAPGERIEMPVRFIVDKDLPQDVTHLTLRYTLFDITARPTSAQSAANSGG